MAGVDDIHYFPNGSIYTYQQGSGGAMTLNDFLSNDVDDYDISGHPHNYDCLSLIRGGVTGALPPSSGGSSFSYQPSANFAGWAVFRYIPVDIASNHRGNFTYIYILVLPPSTCQSNCNLVDNGDFENISDDYVAPFNRIKFNTNGNGNSPDLFQLIGANWVGANGSNVLNFGCAAPPSPVFASHGPVGSNNKYIAIADMGTPGSPSYNKEGVKLKLCNPLIPGSNYILKFWARMRVNNCSGIINFYSSPTEPCPPPTITDLNGNNTCPSGSPFTYTPLITGNVVSNSTWLQHSLPFTYSGSVDANYIVITPSNSGYVFLDDISIESVLDLSASLHSACSGNNGLINLNVSGGITPYSFLWSNGASTQNIAGIASSNYTVTITDNVGCTKSATYTVSASSASPPVAPIIDGDHYGCSLQNCFTVLSPIVGIDYSWTSTSVSNPFGSSITACPGFDPTLVNTITFTASDPLTGCGATSEPFIVEPCCYTATPDHVLIVNQNSSNTAAFVPSNTYYINGTFTIDNIFTITDCPNILMAPGARILVKVGNTLSIDNSHIYAGCNKMWEGIIVEKQASIIIQNGTYIDDANNAVSALPNSYYNIKDSYFNNNFYGLNLSGSSGLTTYGTIANNTFECIDANGALGSLLPPYTGQTPTPGVFSLAGIYADQIQSLKIEKCTFNYMSCGIAAYNSNLYSIENKFNHIGRSTSIAANKFYSWYKHARTAVYAYGGQGNFTCEVNGTQSPIPFPYTAIGTPISDFIDCQIGIHSRSNTNKINNNSMSCIGGIKVVNCKYPYETLINDNFISASIFGIQLTDNKNSLKMECDYNYIYMQPVPYTNNPGGYGIAVYENNINYNVTKVHHNTVLCNAAAGGIYLNGTLQTVVETNKVQIEPAIIILPSKFATSAYINYNAVRSTLRYNLALGIGNNTTGFEAYASNQIMYECNHSDRNATAFSFAMDCDRPQGFSGNLMTNYRTGLLINNACFMGAQDDRGNLWENANGTVGAYVDQGTAQQNLSSFLGTSGTNLGYNYKPSNSPYFLYDPFSLNQNPFQCAQPHPLVPAHDSLTIVDWMVANDSTVSNDSSDAMQWLAQQALYDKYLSDSALASNAQIQNFINSMQLTNVPAFAAVQKRLVELKKPPVTLDSLYVIMKFNLVLLNQLTDSLNSPNLNATLTNMLEMQTDSLRHQLDLWAVMIDSLQKTGNAALAIESDDILIQNAIMQASAIYEQNQQHIDEIKLATIVRDNYDFTPQQTQDLFSIANQCPVYGGTAVLEAQGIYNYIDPEFIFNNNVKCAQVFAARHGNINQLSNYSLSVYPNPATNFITLGYILPINEKVTVSIYDGMGRRVKKLALIGSESNIELQINIAGLPNGIYAYIATANIMITNATGKFTIIK